MIVGHSFGGLIAQILAGRGLRRRHRGRGRSVTLTFDQFRYGWADGVSEEEARRLHDRFHVAAPGKPIFQAAVENLSPATELKVDTKNPDRGPLLIFTGEVDTRCRRR